MQYFLSLKHVRFLIWDKAGKGRVMKAKVTFTIVAVVITKCAIALLIVTLAQVIFLSCWEFCMCVDMCMGNHNVHRHGLLIVGLYYYCPYVPTGRGCLLIFRYFLVLIKTRIH